MVILLEISMGIDALHCDVLGQILTGHPLDMLENMGQIGFTLFVCIVETRSDWYEEEHIFASFRSSLRVCLRYAAKIEAGILGPRWLLEYRVEVGIPVLCKIEVMMLKILQFSVHPQIGNKHGRCNDSLFPVSLGVL